MPAFDPASLDDATQYVVTLSAPIEVAGQRIYPGWDVTLRGDLIKREDIALHVAAATPVTAPESY